MKRHQQFFVIIALMLALISIGYYWKKHMVTSDYLSKAQTKPLYWIDSMEPQVRYPGPGKSRMGMELTPVYPSSENQNTIRISPAIVENLGIQTALVIKGPLPKRIETVGYIKPNENNISHIHTYVDGWLQKLSVKAIGELVHREQLLFQLYSPTLVNAQAEYLLALNSGNATLINAAQSKLLALQISLQQIQKITKTRQVNRVVDIDAPQNGIVASLNVREGMRVTPDIEIMSLVDLSNVWMMTEVDEAQANWVKIGELVEARIAAFPGKIWQGRVDYIYPTINAMTRTLQVRIWFDNPNAELKPDMYADVTILAQPKNDVLSIPLAALGRDSSCDHVIRYLGEGRFQVQQVTAGIESGERVEILSGLSAGDIVVTSGQFLLDSEANITAGLQRLQTTTKIMPMNSRQAK
jgi:Cu(I)/Ag(I) efflux system membrane fusion protein